MNLSLSLHVCIYIYIYLLLCIYIYIYISVQYIYIYIEREREICMYMLSSIYLYIYRSRLRRLGKLAAGTVLLATGGAAGYVAWDVSERDWSVRHTWETATHQYLLYGVLRLVGRWRLRRLLQDAVIVYCLLYGYRLLHYFYWFIICLLPYMFIICLSYVYCFIIIRFIVFHLLLLVYHMFIVFIICLIGLLYVYLSEPS